MYLENVIFLVCLCLLICILFFKKGFEVFVVFTCGNLLLIIVYGILELLN